MKSEVDLLVSARRIYTVDDAFSTAESMAISDGRIVAAGSRAQLGERFAPRRVLDLGEAFVYPGFMDPHCHFLSYGIILRRANLFETGSWEEAVERLVAHHQRAGEYWVQGRGWNQNDWAPREFPDRALLDRVFPDNPVLIIRIDGHAAMANGRALALAGLNIASSIPGGALGASDGRLTGLLLDNAVEAVKAVVPVPDEAAKRRALLEAQANCFAVGLTSVSNAGTDLEDVLLMERLQREGAMKIRMYAMLNACEANFAYFAKFAAGRSGPDSGQHGDRRRGPLCGERLTVRSFKMYADGALGSRGASLLEPYSDDPGNYGLKTLEPEELETVCGIARDSGFQMNVHCIGDAAVRAVLDSYEKFLQPGNDHRWRIEHAQVVHPDDLPRFGRLGVIPSIQTTHATSDMPWMQDRLGASRMSRAHAYRSLLAQNGWLPNGSDFPIEKINPLYGFHAGVARTDRCGMPPGGFMPEQALTRVQALRAMTAWAARANFEEKDRGSLEPGKWADFTVLSGDIMAAPEGELRDMPVLATAVGGEIVFERA
ncbi:MAG: amidohydrolase [Rectinemataceae bacterium]